MGVEYSPDGFNYLLRGARGKHKKRPIETSSIGLFSSGEV